MATAFWKGAINFGMVVIPVRMYIAIKNDRPRFHYLHKKCLTRPRQVYYCAKDDEYLTAQEMARGYEYTKGQYIVIAESDFARLPLETSHAIDVVGFVPAGEIDPIYYYDTHYLEPEEIGAKPYCLLRETLREMEKVALARVAFQRREHLCAVRPMGKLLVLQTLHFQNEIRPPDEVSQPDKELTAEEKKMAKSLIGEMARRFQPKDYKDHYETALKKLVAAKLQGKEIVLPKEEKPAAVPDLMAALRQSIEIARKETAAKQKVAARPAK